MGMYTEFVFGVSLLSTTPGNVLDILNYLVNSEEFNYKKELPNHVFFKCDRYKAIATCSSYYFGCSESVSRFDYLPDSISKEYILSIRSNLKNYDNEIEKFVDWIRPYVSSGSGTNDLLGYKLYEESIVPYLFYKDEEFEKLVNKNINADSYIKELY